MGTRLAKIAGTLTELSGEELARQQGMEAAPLSPLGAAGIGASQDVAKMSGTGEQIRASLRETLKERTETKDVMAEAERGGARARFDVGRIQSQLQTMTGLGSLDNRIASQIRTNLMKVAEGGIKNPIDAQAVRAALSKGGTVAPADADVNTLVNDLATLQSTATPEKVVEILKKLGISATIADTSQSLAEKLVQTGIFKQAGTADIKQIMDKAVEAQAGLKVKQLGTDIGFDKNEVAAALKTTAERLDEWTLEEVKAALQAYSSQNFVNVDELRGVLASPAASQSQKDFARKRLAELGAIGVTSLEEKANDLERQMEEGDTVKFGTVQVRVSDLLTKPEYKAVIANALESPEALAELEKTDAELAKWIKGNQARLTNVRADLAKGTADFIAVQNQYNTLLKDTPPDLLDKLAPGWRDAKTNKDTAGWVASLSPGLQSVINEKDQNLRTVKTAVLSALTSKMNPAYANSFSDAALTAIATAAGGDQAKAASLTQDWLSAESVQNIPFDFKEPQLGTGPTDYTQDDYTKAQTSIIQSLNKGYTQTSVNQFVKDMKAFAVSQKPEDRAKAVEMFKDLAAIQTLFNSTFNEDNLQKIKQDKQIKATTSEVDTKVTESMQLLNPLLQSLTSSKIAWVRDRGSEQIQKIIASVSGASARIRDILIDTTLSDQLKTKKIEQIKGELDSVKTRTAQELAAFSTDKGTYWGDVVESSMLLAKSGLRGSLTREENQAIARRILGALQAFNKDKTAANEPIRTKLREAFAYYMDYLPESEWRK